MFRASGLSANLIHKFNADDYLFFFICHERDGKADVDAGGGDDDVDNDENCVWEDPGRG